MTGIIFINASRVRKQRMSRRCFTAAATGMLAATALPGVHNARGQGTPESAPGKSKGGPEPLLPLLSVVPHRLGDDGGIPFFYADLAGQFSSLEIDQRQLYSDAFVDLTEPAAIFLGAIQPLAIASDAFTLATNEDFTGFIGFQPFLAGQAVLAGTPPDQLSLFRGGIDLDALPAAWKASGYQRRTSDNGAEVWTIGEAGEVDISRDPFISPAFNNATVLDSGIVVFGQLFDTVAEAADLAVSGGESLWDDPAIGAGVSALEETTVSAIGIDASFLDVAFPTVPDDQREAVEEELIGEQSEFGDMPVWSAMIIGIAGGFTNPPFAPNALETPVVTAKRHAPGESPRGGAIMARLVTGSEDDAAAAADVVERRWNGGNSAVLDRPLAELMTIEESRAIGEVAAIDFAPVRLPSVWIDLVLQRDLLPFAFEMPAGEEEATPDG